MFTEGDWEARFFEGIGWGVETIEHQICGLKPGEAASANLPTQEHEANAHLIAAAPDMYKALQQALRTFEAHHIRETDNRYLMLKQALAKADNEN